MNKQLVIYQESEPLWTYIYHGHVPLINFTLVWAETAINHAVNTLHNGCY